MVEDILEKITHITRIKPNGYTYAVSYKFWVENLFERCMRLFTYEGLPETMPRKEIEQRFIMQGFNIITDKADGKLRTFYGQLTDFTGFYYDEPLKANTTSPMWAESLDVNKECIVVDNSSARNSLYPLINHYAVLLAHASISLQNVLVNGRDANGTPIANTEQQKESIKAYYNDIWNGKRSCILDKTFLGVEFKAEHGAQALNIKDCMETINNLIDNFYNDIGVKTSKDKKGNMLTPEIEADNPMLLLNIKDMLDARRLGFEKVNSKYGTNIIVDIAEEIKQSMKESEVDNNEND